MSGAELEYVLKHFGHTLDVHKVHYRQTSTTIERTQVAKILLMLQNNCVNKFSGASLKEVDLSGKFTNYIYSTPFLVYILKLVKIVVIQC